MTVSQRSILAANTTLHIRHWILKTVKHSPSPEPDRHENCCQYSSSPKTSLTVNTQCCAPLHLPVARLSHHLGWVLTKIVLTRNFTLQDVMDAVSALVHDDPWDWLLVHKRVNEGKGTGENKAYPRIKAFCNCFRWFCHKVQWVLPVQTCVQANCNFVLSAFLCVMFGV